MHNYQEIIEAAWQDRALLKEETTQSAIKEILALLDKGELRVAAPDAYEDYARRSGTVL